jgi:serine/threonine protein kinase
MNSTVSSPAPPPIPDHELVRRIGAGSYGEVWMARSVTGALRAVKIVYRRSFASDRPYAREFDGILKFEPISRTHPGLVSILHVGRNEATGCFYYLMELADDLERGTSIDPMEYVPRTLDALLRHGPIPVADCVALAIALTDSVRHIHQHGLVHRDIKPANIIFIQDLPKLADIGLVTGAGQNATFVGTEGYIPPEGPGLPPADLFSLGKVIYQMGTGLACDQFPDLPDQGPAESDPIQFALLNSVILKACEPDLTRRFHSAADLHEALLAVQRNAPLPAEQPAPQRIQMGHRVMILFTPDDPRDARLACLIEERLRVERFAVFLDDRAGFGVPWARNMEAEMRKADALILLLSDASVGDEIFNYQVDRAIQTRRLNPGIVTLPVRITLSRPLPSTLQEAFAVQIPLQWNAETEDEELVDDILQMLRSALQL